MKNYVDTEPCFELYYISIIMFCNGFICRMILYFRKTKYDGKKSKMKRKVKRNVKNLPA